HPETILRRLMDKMSRRRSTLRISLDIHSSSWFLRRFRDLCGSLLFICPKLIHKNCGQTQPI
ncbi:hypothetical protein DRO37_05660, partial [Candidatus Bathyarchaeota archaeon]